MTSSKSKEQRGRSSRQRVRHGLGEREAVFLNEGEYAYGIPRVDATHEHQHPVDAYISQLGKGHVHVGCKRVIAKQLLIFHSNHPRRLRLILGQAEIPSNPRDDRFVRLGRDLAKQLVHFLEGLQSGLWHEEVCCRQSHEPQA